MPWLVFSYSLAAQARSSARVTVWRRLKQLGAVAVAGGAQVLPARDECDEALQWLAQEIRHAGGEAVVMRVEQFSGLADAELIELFQADRAAAYAELEPELKQLESASGRANPQRRPEALERLRRKDAALRQADYFQSPAGSQFAARLSRLSQALSPTPKPVTTAAMADYQGKVWVTRPQPHVDRLACAWLIRRYIQADAVIRYAPRAEPGQVGFDLEPSEFSHQGGLCSFEAMRLAFGLDDPGLPLLAEIVHDIDLHAQPYRQPEAHGVEAILSGWRQARLGDAELEARGLALFDGLHAALGSRATPRTSRPAGKRGR